MNVVEEIKEIVAKLDKIDDYNNSLCDKLSVVDSKTQDLLHYIENNKINVLWCYRMLKEIKSLRQERRKIKNDMELLSKYNEHKNKIISKDNRQFLLAEATREKEKTTLYKRNQIIETLTKTINDIVNITFKVYDTMEKNEITDIDGVASFGGYANPSFEAQVETIGKAKTNGVMSIETSIEELYGDTKDEKWKKEEVKRIKNESGIVDMEEPSINEDLDLIENEEMLKGGVEDGGK